MQQKAKSLFTAIPDGVVMRALKSAFGLALILTPCFAIAMGMCAPYAQDRLESGLLQTESSGNEFAIGVVGGHLVRQPRNRTEAIATAISLEAQGFDFSVGCRQVNRANLRRYGLTLQAAFDPQANSMAGRDIYRECLGRAKSTFGQDDMAVRAALSCYYSGNFIAGQRKEGNQPSYVDKVLRNSRSDQSSVLEPAIPVVPTMPEHPKVVPAKGPTVTPAIEAIPKAGNPKPADWDIFNEL
jgi:type IV secretion system protein VirB1